MTIKQRGMARRFGPFVNLDQASLKCYHANYFLQKGVQVKTQKSH